MLEKITGWWWGLPTWGKWVSAVCGVFAVSSIGPAFREGDALAFVENFLALIFHYGIIIGSFTLAIWAGVRAAEHYGRNWTGWLIGLCIMVFSAMALTTFERLPGVGWRMKAMSNSDCYVDWDGRSNPTVCD